MRTKSTQSCAFCGEGFTPTRSTQRFCSDRCWRTSWRIAHRDHLSDYWRKYRAEHREELAKAKAEDHKRHYYADLERSRAKSREAYYRNWERNHNRGRAYYASGRGKDNLRRWRERNPEKALAGSRRWKALLRHSAAGTHTADEWHELLVLYAFQCAYCGQAKPLVRDHLTPLSAGGTNSIDNIIPACRSCNSRKGGRPLIVFLRG